jgi:hypothetical protein
MALPWIEPHFSMASMLGLQPIHHPGEQCLRKELRAALFIGKMADHALNSSDSMNTEQLSRLKNGAPRTWLQPIRDYRPFNFAQKALRRPVTKHILTGRYQLVTFTHDPVPPP